MKGYLKNEAIRLRQSGLSYSEILKEVRVAKSTLSLWLRSIGLTKVQKQRLTQKKYEAILRGAVEKKRKREELELGLKNKAINQVGAIDRKGLFLVGVALYWAEGSRGQGVVFANSDAKMIEVFLRWLRNCLGIPLSRVQFELYIHESAIGRKHEIIRYWAEFLKVSEMRFGRVYFKRQVRMTNKSQENYRGLVRVRVKRSTNLNRQVAGWIYGLYKNTAESSNGRTSPFGGEYF